MNNSPTPETPSTPSVSPDARSPDQTRRKLAGLGGAAIFTLASRPVLAVTCNSPSAAASGNLSFHGTPPNCTGDSPSTWLTLADGGNVLNNGFPGGNVLFNSVFADGNGIDWPDAGDADEADGRLYAVMSAPDGANPRPNPISAEFAATLLNIRGLRIPPEILTEPQLINMWIEWRDNTVFTPTAGVTWTATDIVTYLRSLQGA